MKVYESAFSVAVNALEGSVALARQQCHDQVIANTGRARRSGVTWSHYAPASRAQEQITEEGSDIVLPLDAQLVCLTVPDGVLVIATVEVDPHARP